MTDKTAAKGGGKTTVADKSEDGVKLALEEKWKQEKEISKMKQEDKRNEESVPSNDESVSEEAFEQLKQERDEYLDHLQRLQAEFDNFRKRTQKERQEMSQFLLQDFMTGLLTVVENMERALHQGNETQDVKSYQTGVEMVFQQLMNLLEEKGLRRIETVGEPFDPLFHEAVSQVESEEFETGIIIAEFSPGYLLKDRVLRAPKVQVSSGPVSSETEAGDSNTKID